MSYNQKPTITLEDSANFLTELFHSEVSELTLLSGGEWSQAYSFIFQSKKLILRWSHSNEGFVMDTIASSLSQQSMPIPRIIKSGRWHDMFYAISDCIEGAFFESLSTAVLERTLPSLFRLFDSLRTADLSATDGYGSWDKNQKGSYSSWKNYLLGVKDDNLTLLIHGWRKNLESSEMGMKSFNKLYEKLAQLVENCPENRELIHSDLLNKNLFVKDSKISGVIDWQCSLYGDSLYDIAWFKFYAPWYPQFEKVQLVQRALEHYKEVASATAKIEERLLCYQLHIGLGSIAYNAYKQDWPAAREVADYAYSKVL